MNDTRWRQARLAIVLLAACIFALLTVTWTLIDKVEALEQDYYHHESVYHDYKGEA